MLREVRGTTVLSLAAAAILRWEGGWGLLTGQSWCEEPSKAAGALPPYTSEMI
jgi:hypothetical protein